MLLKKVINFIAMFVMSLVIYENGYAYDDAYELPNVASLSKCDALISIAESQIGYHEDEDGKTIYSEWAGQSGRGWCSEFISWCANKAGISEKIIPIGTSSGKFMKNFSGQERFFKLNNNLSDTSDDCEKYANGIIETDDLGRGDILLTETDGDISNGPDHSSIFIDMDNNYIYTIDGNCNDEVVYRKRDIAEVVDIIHGVCKPNYEDDSRDKSAKSIESNDKNSQPKNTTDDNKYYDKNDDASFTVNGVELPIKGYEIGKPWDNCWTFAKIIYEEIWGTNDGNNMLQNLEQDDLKITEENVERFISDAEPGANIRVEDGRDVNQHSMILVEKDNKGFTVYHGNMNGGIYFTYYTYEGFAEDFSEYRYFAYVTWPKAHEYAGSSDDEKFSFVYTVKFDTNSGSDIDDEKVSENSKLEMPEDPQKDGYEFGGWFTDEELTTKYNSSKKVTESFTLYAKWIEEENPQDKQIILTVGKRAASVFGKTKSNDVAPKIVNDRTMLPARFVAESLGANVEWVSEDKKVRITKGDTEILIFIGSNKAKVNGKSITLDSPAFIEDERTYTPIRFICEELGATVDWNGETQEITITQE